MNNFKIGLLSTVRHKVHGFEGVIVSREEHLYSCIFYGVQGTALKDGRPIAAEHFDQDSLEVVVEKDNSPPKFKFELGSAVRDRITGFEGIVATRAEWVGIPAHYSIKSKKLHEGKPIAPVGCDEARLELVVAAEPHATRQTGAMDVAPREQC